MKTTPDRVVFLDYLRVVACFMVIVVHSCQFFYVDPVNYVPHIRSLSDGIWVNAIDSALRCCVPLFVMASGYLLLPTAFPTREFLAKRTKRVVIPFLVWSLAYAVLPLLWGEYNLDQTKDMLSQLLYNFNEESEHLWFVYMIISLYLFIPVISPWIEKASKRDMQYYLALWFVGLFLYYIRIFTGGAVYGECFWSNFNMLFYFTGYMGYMVAAVYIRKYVDWSFKRTLAICVPAFLLGYAVTTAIWHAQIGSATFEEQELSWAYCTPNVAIMTLAVFTLFSRCKGTGGRIYPLIGKLSQLSFGLYLIHIFVLNQVKPLFFGHFSTPVTILLIAATTFAVSAVLSYLISLLPKSKWLLG